MKKIATLGLAMAALTLSGCAIGFRHRVDRHMNDRHMHQTRDQRGPKHVRHDAPRQMPHLGPTWLEVSNAAQHMAEEKVMRLLEAYDVRVSAHIAVHPAVSEERVESEHNVKRPHPLPDGEIERRDDPDQARHQIDSRAEREERRFARGQWHADFEHSSIAVSIPEHFALSGDKREEIRHAISAATGIPPERVAIVHTPRGEKR